LILCNSSPIVGYAVSNAATSDVYGSIMLQDKVQYDFTLPAPCTGSYVRIQIRKTTLSTGYAVYRMFPTTIFGSVSCAACATGSYSAAQASTCNACAPGKYSRVSEVFHIFSPDGYKVSWTNAAGECAALGARLASLTELQTAQSHGAQWCSCGWNSDGTARFPM
jgi:hyaluronan/proteoglycan link protein 3